MVHVASQTFTLNQLRQRPWQSFCRSRSTKDARIEADFGKPLAVPQSFQKQWETCVAVSMQVKIISMWSQHHAFAWQQGTVPGTEGAELVGDWVCSLTSQEQNPRSLWQASSFTPRDLAVSTAPPDRSGQQEEGWDRGQQAQGSLV